MRVTSTSTQSLGKVKMIIYGESGAGKTSLAKTINEPTLIISSEGGLLCLQDHEPPIDVIDITLDDDENLIPKEERIKRLGKVYEYLLTDECKKKYKWIFIDSLSEISQNMMEALNVEFPERKDSLVMYGENAKRMRSLVKSFRDLPCYNVVFTALQSTDKDDTNKRYTGISVVGKISEQLPAFFDEVFYMNAIEDKETNTVKRFLVTSKTDGLVAKDRSGKLERINPADLGLIASKINKTNKKEQ